MNGKRLSRRDFLRLSSVAVTGALLAACQPQVVEEQEKVQEDEEVPAAVAPD